MVSWSSASARWSRAQRVNSGRCARPSRSRLVARRGLHATGGARRTARHSSAAERGPRFQSGSIRYQAAPTGERRVTVKPHSLESVPSSQVEAIQQPCPLGRRPRRGDAARLRGTTGVRDRRRSRQRRAEQLRPRHHRPRRGRARSIWARASTPRTARDPEARCSGSEALTSGELRVAVTAASRVRAAEIDDPHQHPARC